MIVDAKVRERAAIVVALVLHAYNRHLQRHRRRYACRLVAAPQGQARHPQGHPPIGRGSTTTPPTAQAVVDRVAAAMATARERG